MEEPAVHRRALDEAHRAGVRVRENGLRPVRRAMMSVSRSAISPSASSQLIRSKRPEPFGPDAAQGMQEPVAVVRPLHVPVHLRAEEAAA